EAGMTVIFVTHEAEIAEHSPRVIHIRDGEIGGEEMVAAPRTAYDREQPEKANGHVQAPGRVRMTPTQAVRGVSASRGSAQAPRRVRITPTQAVSGVSASRGSAQKEVVA